MIYPLFRFSSGGGSSASAINAETQKISNLTTGVGVAGSLADKDVVIIAETNKISAISAGAAFANSVADRVRKCTLFEEGNAGLTDAVCAPLAYTRGPWVQMLITGFRSAFIGIRFIQQVLAVGNFTTHVQYDIGTGAPGAEVALVTNLLDNVLAGGTLILGTGYLMIPADIPAGTRIAIQLGAGPQGVIGPGDAFFASMQNWG